MLFKLLNILKNTKCDRYLGRGPVFKTKSLIYLVFWLSSLFSTVLACSSYELKYQILSKVPSGVREFLSVREVLDVVKEFKVHRLPVDRFLSLLKPLQSRYYSISSSPHVVSTTVCVCT